MTLRIATNYSWERAGLVLHGEDDAEGGFVVGDPCLVRDEEAGLWRMLLFVLPPGHGQALCEGDPADPSAWRFGPALEFTNPESLAQGGVFKPFVLLDAARPGHAAKIAGHYALLLVTDHEAKVVRRAWSPRLSGPWTIEREPLIARGSGDDFDAKHVDAVSGYAFFDRDELVYFYMGYPLRPQRHALSPLGSSQGAASETMAEAIASLEATMSNTTPAPRTLRKHGIVLAPGEEPGHWAAGWVGGLQLLPGRERRWVAVVNASPTAPRADDDAISHEEPPPSLGGFAFTDAALPIDGWEWSDEPFEHVGAVPEAARRAGESTNFWRHYALPLADGRLALFYNSGPYFQKRLYLKLGSPLSGS